MCLAVPGKIVALRGPEADLRMGSVDFAGIRRDVCLAFVPEAREGDFVLVHVGFAIATIDEREARRVFDALEELGELEELRSQDGAP